MKKFTLIFTFLVLTTSFLFAQTANVTIQVNMSQISDLYEGGSVWVYMDSNWNEYYTMTPDAADSIYSYTIEKDVGSLLTYSFSYQNGPDENSDYVTETVPAQCANNDGFREITTPAADTTLTAVSYGSCYESGITVRVDMTDITDLYEGGSVWVYMDDDWNEYYTMTDANGDGVYAHTLMKDPASTLYYRFSYQNGPDEDSDYVTETVPTECAAENGFRELLVAAGDTVLPAFTYGSCSNVAPIMANITFQVDMSNETVINNDVQVVIKDPWIWTALTDQGNGTWSATVTVNPNKTYPYTFVNGGQDNWEGEESVPAGCNFGTESAPERHVTVGETDTTLALTNFGECPVDVPTSNVTIQVNMSQVNDMYDGGSVWVYMDADWNEYYTMTADANDSVYSYTVEKAAGSKLAYSFAYQNGPDENNDYVTETVPDDCSNDIGFREVMVPDTDTTLMAVSYGSCYGIGATFRVNLAEISDLYEGGSVWVYMDADWNEYYTMTDPDEDGIYTITLMKDQGPVYYSFAYQNGADEWNDFVSETVPDLCAADNGFREVILPATDTVLPAFAFGSCDESSPTTIMVTFQVNMSAETVENNDVQVVIKNPWIWTALADQGDGIWSGSVEVNSNNTYPYTFVNGGQDNWDGEESVPAACSMGTESAPERHISVLDADTTIAIVAFGSCGPNVSVVEFDTSEIAVYPNPANNRLNISNNQSAINTVRIIDISGRTLIQKTNILEREITIDVSNLNNGMYSVIVTGESIHSTNKIIIKH
jgi:hypothetical protein